MSAKGPGLFSGIGKKARDLLVEDYSNDQKLTVTTFTGIGVEEGYLCEIGYKGLNSTVVKRGGLYAGNVEAQYKHKNAVADFKFDTESNVSSVLRVTDILPSTHAIASFRLPDYSSGKLEVQYFHEHATFSTAFALNKSPYVDITATIGTPNIAFGAEASYLTNTGHFAKYNAGVSVTKADSNASAILADKGDSVRVSYLHLFDRLNGGAVVGEISRKFSTNENTLTVGCSYVVDSQTAVKAKLNNHGNFGALLQHQLTPKSFLTISGTFDTNALTNNPKFGLALFLKP